MRDLKIGPFRLSLGEPRGGLRHGHLTWAKFVHRDSDGRILYESDWEPNNLANEGERNMLDVYLRNAAGPASFRVRLFGSTPLETSSLASLTNEPGGSLGYAPQAVNRDATVDGWPTLDNQFSGGDFQAESKTVTFRATSGIWPNVTHAALATTSDNSGLLIDFTQLRQPRQLRSGQQLEIIYAPRLS